MHYEIQAFTKLWLSAYILVCSILVQAAGNATISTEPQWVVEMNLSHTGVGQVMVWYAWLGFVFAFALAMDGVFPLLRSAISAFLKRVWLYIVSLRISNVTRKPKNVHVT